MIPSSSGFLTGNIEIKEQSSKTYKMDFDTERIRGFADGVEAMKQAIFKIINTERYQYLIYSWNYGIETIDLYGKSTAFVMSELKRRISDALLWDSRIQSVDNFEFTADRGKISCTFTVHTIFGDIDAERAVNI